MAAINIAEATTAPSTPAPREARIVIPASPSEDLGAAKTSGDLLEGAGAQPASRRRIAAFALLTTAGLAGCWVLAGLVASNDAVANEEPPASFASLGFAGPGGLERRASGEGGEGEGASEAATTAYVAKPECRNAEPGEPCHRFITWVMTEGIKQRGQGEYPGLTEKSTFEEVQAALHTDPWAQCPRPCVPELMTATSAHMLAGQGASADAAVSAQSSSGVGWYPSGRVVAQGQWCAGNEPQPGWQLQGCGKGAGIQVKVLTYNLFWWSLFGRRGGNGGSAGHLIAGASNPKPFDIMAFQECEGIGWVLGDAGLGGHYAAVTGPHALCIAYRQTEWNLLADSSQDIAEDRADQWYGTRAGMWVRLQHRQTGQEVFFINHHGPLPLNSGGRCGGEATAFNLLKLIGTQAREGDVTILVGDFNAGPDSETVRSIRSRMHPVFTGASFGGVDHVLSSCANVAGIRNLGSGGSDHDALETVFQL